MPKIIDSTTLAQGGKNILVYGPPKTFKTRFACTAPKPLHLLDLDRGALSIAKDYKPGEVTVVRFEKPEADKIGSTQERGTQRVLLDDFIGHFNSYFNMPEDKLPKTIVLDSLTELGNIVMEFVLALNARKLALFPDWGQAGEKMREVFRAGLSLPCNFILVAHEQTDKDEMLGNLRIDPMIYGALRQEVARFFDDVFHAQMEKDDKGNMVPKLLTCGDGLVKSAGARSRPLPKLVNPSWQEIYG